MISKYFASASKSTSKFQATHNVRSSNIPKFASVKWTVPTQKNAFTIATPRREFSTTQWKNIGMKVPYFPQALRFYSSTKASDEFNQAVSLAQKGQLEEAVQFFDRELRNNPKNYEARFRKGEVLNKLGMYEQAYKEVEQSIQEDPKAPNVLAFEVLGDAYLGLDRYEDAITSFQYAIDKDPNNIHMHLKKAKLLSESDDKTAAALHHYDAVLEIDPYNPEALVGKATIHLRMEPDIPTPTPDTPSEKLMSQEDTDLQVKLFEDEQIKHAMSFCVRGLEKHPSNVKLLTMKAVTLNQEGKPNEAIEILNDVIDREKKRLEGVAFSVEEYDTLTAAYNAKAGAMLDINKPDHAIVSLDKTLAIQPNNISALLSKAMILHDLGMTRDAVDVLNDTLNHYPDMTRAQAMKTAYEAILKKNDGISGKSAKAQAPSSISKYILDVGPGQ